MADAPGGEPRGPAHPVASIVIPVLERVDLLTDCLDSLARLASKPERETIVVANGTTEERLRSLRQRDDIRLVRSRINLGFGGGCCWGARFAHGRYLVFLNDDAQAEDGWLTALIGAAESDARIGAVGSRLADFDGVLQEVGGILWSDGGTHRLCRGLPATEAPTDDRLRDVDYSSGCGLLVTREAWEAAGGFDPGYFPGYHEDVDLCLSLRNLGFRTVVAPAAKLRHHEGASTEEGFRSLAAQRSGRRFVARWRDVLEEYEPHPDPPDPERVARAVAAAERRTRERPLGLGPAPPAAPVDSNSEDEAFLLRLQVTALEAALELHEQRIAGLTAEVARLLPEHEKLERLRHVADRLPLAHALSRVLARRLTR